MKKKTLRFAAFLGLGSALLLAFGCVHPTTPEVAARPTAALVAPAVGQQTFTVATFNIENLGVTKLGRPEVVAKIVEVIRKYDVVAIQEISDKSLQTPVRLLAEINRSPVGDRYGVIASERSGIQADDRGPTQEQYAFFYNTRTLKVVDQGGLFPDGASDLFQREPFAVQLQTADGKLSFVLLTVHTMPKRAPQEIAALGEACIWAKEHFDGEAGVVILGDFNAGKAYAKPAQLNAIRATELPFLWIVPDNADTTLAKAPQAHDRIVVEGVLAQRFTSRWGVDQAFVGDSISDHWPVWAEFAAPGSN